MHHLQHLVVVVAAAAAAAAASAMIGLQAMTAGEDMAAAASVVVAILGAAALTAEVEEVVALATVGAEVVVVQLGWIRRPCTRCTSRYILLNIVSHVLHMQCKRCFWHSLRHASCVRRCRAAQCRNSPRMAARLLSPPQIMEGCRSRAGTGRWADTMRTVARVRAALLPVVAASVSIRMVVEFLTVLLEALSTLCPARVRWGLTDSRSELPSGCAPGVAGIGETQVSLTCFLEKSGPAAFQLLSNGETRLSLASERQRQWQARGVPQV